MTSSVVSTRCVNPPKCIVILLAWWQCPSSVRKKLIQAHVDRHEAFVLATTAPWYAFAQYRDDALNEVATQVDQALNKALEEFPNLSVHVHCFSNNGCLVFRVLTERFWKGASWTLSSVTFDSCPHRYTFNSLYGALAGSRLVAFPFSWIAAWMAWFWVVALVPRSHFRKSLIHTIARQTPRAQRELFIYSKKGDIVTTAQDVEFVISTRKSLHPNLALETFTLPQSPHVAHARTDPLQYWDRVSSVIQSKL